MSRPTGDPAGMDVVADLLDESEAVDRLVRDLEPADWDRSTPAVGWTIAHQIAHLAWTDYATVLAITDPAGFERLVEVARRHFATFVDRFTEESLAPPAELLQRWGLGRDVLHGHLAGGGGRFPWFGTSMSPRSGATGRLMETWAHGLDIADTLGVPVAPTDRLRHVAFLGYRTIGHSFVTHGFSPPPDPFRVELSTPDGRLWTYGPVDAVDRVTGPALDFCLLVTQRRDPADLDLRTTGEHAARWRTIAQAFAGPPGTKRTKPETEQNTPKTEQSTPETGQSTPRAGQSKPATGRDDTQGTSEGHG